jgi:hypothetical protein
MPESIIRDSKLKKIKAGEYLEKKPSLKLVWQVKAVFGYDFQVNYPRFAPYG